MASSRNDITGDAIVNNKGDTEKYTNGWDAIWGKKKKDPAKDESPGDNDGADKQPT